MYKKLSSALLSKNYGWKGTLWVRDIIVIVSGVKVRWAAFEQQRVVIKQDHLNEWDYYNFKLSSKLFFSFPVPNTNMMINKCFVENIRVCRVAHDFFDSETLKGTDGICQR
jgi:hypothetical protein